MSADDIITKGSNMKPLHAIHTKKRDLHYQSTKAYPRTVPVAHKDFQSTEKTGHTHAVQSSQKAFPHSHFQEMFQDKKQRQS